MTTHEFRRTEPGATQTAVGWIPHNRHPYWGFEVPVKLRTTESPRGGLRLESDHNGLPYPEYTPDGRYYWMLPGGQVRDLR